MKLTAVLALVVLGLSGTAQQSRPLPGIPTSTAFSGTLTTGAIPSMGAPVFDTQTFVGPAKRTASSAIGSTVAFAMGQARASRSRPLAINGRLFIQGLHRIAALDAYNGAILWSLEIPDLERFNMPRDCSNWCARQSWHFPWR